MKLYAICILLITMLGGCAPLVVGGVIGYEIGHHHHRHMPMGVHR